MSTYEGSCHCGAILFRATTDNTRVIVCNCSICRKKGARYLRVAPRDFELISGSDSLGKYQFGTRTASHFFCRHCGIHPYSQPRSAPDMISVNIQCIDNPSAQDCGFEFVSFDGEHWEEAVTALNKSLST